MSTPELVGGGLLVVTTLLALACPVAYQVTTRGTWRRSDVGRHLMAFMASMAAVLALSSVRFVLVTVAGRDDPAWFVWIRLIVFVSVPIVLAGRLSIILDARRSD